MSTPHVAPSTQTQADRRRVAGWMVDVIRDRGRVSLAEMVDELSARGDGHWIVDGHGVDDRLLATFRRVHAGTIRWVQAGQYWTSV
jgi:hypothetical protein